MCTPYTNTNANGVHYISVLVQYNGVVYMARYWYTMVLWLTRVDQSERPVADPLGEARVCDAPLQGPRQGEGRYKLTLA